MLHLHPVLIANLLVSLLACTYLVCDLLNPMKMYLLVPHKDP